MGAETPRCTAVDGGSRLEVKVSPGARADAIGGVHDGRLRVRVTAAPERGKANRAVLALLAKTLGVSRSRLAVVAGETDAHKSIRIEGLAPAAVRARLDGSSERG